MRNDVVLALMIFLHIIDDFCLQGIMASMKQKSWWQKDPVAAKPLYRHDYIAALLAHSFSWAFMTMIPTLIWGKWSFGILISNMLLHAYIDDMKANRGIINLIADQSIHIGQILITWFFLVVI